MKGNRIIENLKISLLTVLVVELYSFLVVTIDCIARVPNFLFETYAFIYSFSRFLFPAVFVLLLVFLNKQKNQIGKDLSRYLYIIIFLYIANFIYRTFLVEKVYGLINNNVLINFIAVIGHLFICAFSLFFFIKITKYKNE